MEASTAFSMGGIPDPIFSQPNIRKIAVWLCETSLIPDPNLQGGSYPGPVDRIEQIARAAEAIFDRSGHNQICHHCLCGASTHIVCKSHVHVKHANFRGVWGHAPPENF